MYVKTVDIYAHFSPITNIFWNSMNIVESRQAEMCYSTFRDRRASCDGEYTVKLAKNSVHVECSHTKDTFSQNCSFEKHDMQRKSRFFVEVCAAESFYLTHSHNQLIWVFFLTLIMQHIRVNDTIQPKRLLIKLELRISGGRRCLNWWKELFEALWQFDDLNKFPKLASLRLPTIWRHQTTNQN